MSDVTQILSQIESGDSAAADQLLPLVYQELRQLAASKLTHEMSGQTLQATALVHEAYVRLVDVEKAQQWDSRGHFFAAAAEAMRRILVEHARRRLGKQRGGDRRRVELNDVTATHAPNAEQIIQVSEALEKLARADPVASEFIKLRFFGGLTVTEAAESLGVSRATAYAHWAYAKATLRRFLS